MDYKKEARNGLKFRQLYGGLKDAKVPEMYLDLTTSKVLVMEWVEGQKLPEVKDLYLVEQIRKTDKQTKKCKASPHVLPSMFISMLTLNWNFGFWVMPGMLSMQFFIFSVDPFTLSLGVLEGIAISFKPDYKILSSTYPWIARKVLTDISPKLKSLEQALLYKDGVFRIDRLESFLSEVRFDTLPSSVPYGKSSSNKPALQFSLARGFSFHVGFLREILLEELAKAFTGASAYQLILGVPYDVEQKRIFSSLLKDNQ
ncbi:ABC1 atypical kinase-like domain [Dillenia turbinata]|uniref:ABC1 atypical kinase-like domain n=1 Tax=Dillenia turbinata TaxID=194707 RepID=A0AAN8VYN9_9MAGN